MLIHHEVTVNQSLAEISPVLTHCSLPFPIVRIVLRNP